VTARHKAAAAAFIQWLAEVRERDRDLQEGRQPPCGSSVIKQLASSGQLEGGQRARRELKLVKPLFPQGAPVWYSQFSADAQGLLNSAVKGQTSISDALSQLATKATGHATDS